MHSMLLSYHFNHSDFIELTQYLAFILNLDHSKFFKLTDGAFILNLDHSKFLKLTDG